jgi:iron complex outermembrane receptor protein
MRIDSFRAGLVLLACITSAYAVEPEPTPAPDPAPASAAQPAEDADTLPTIPVNAPPPARAAKATPAETDPVVLDKVEVTAQRRKQKLQDVPVAVTAMARDQLESRGIERLDDLNSLAPGLQISRSPANTTISQITIRGSSQINPAIYWDPAVGVYLDGVYIGKGQGSIFDIVNLDSVEVLRGPQGTLYGRNTIGGTINFVTRAPSGVFGGDAAVEFGNLNARVQRVSMDLPRLGIADITLGARSERRDGWVTTTPTSPVPELNNRHNDGQTLGLLLNFGEDLDGMYRYDHTNINQTNNYLQLYRYDRPEAAQYVSKTRQTHADINSPSLEQSQVNGHSFTLTWSPSELFVLKSISGYRKVKWTDFLDLDGSPMLIAQTKRYTDYKQLSQDLNLSGHADTWNYTGGIYYFKDDGYTNNPQVFYDGALNFDSQYGTHTKAWATYGQADWRPLQPLTLTAGVRYTREKKGLDRTLGFSPATGAPFVYYIPAGFQTPGATFSATTPVFSAAWRFNKQINTYVRYAEGFKSGGYNGEYSNLQDTPDTGSGTQNDNEKTTSTPFKPERQKSLELGAKTSFVGGRALFNLAAFRNKLTDLQISTFVGQGAAASTISNAGKATVQGVELESAVIPFEGTQLRANYAYLKPKYTEFIDGGANVADNRAFVHAPKHSYNLVLDSRLFNRPWGELRAIVDYAWTDSFYTYPYQLAPDPNPPGQQKQVAGDTKVPATGLLNAKLSLAAIPIGNTTRGEISLWGRNLTDNAAVSNYIDFGPGLFASLTVVNFVEPRTFGVSAVLRW